MSFVEISNVDLIYGGVARTNSHERGLALSGLNLRLEKGAFVAVVGPSGCGKSTLLRLVAGLINPSRGAVRINNHRVEKPVSGVGMAFQSPTLLPWRNIRDNVLLPLEIVEPYRSQSKTQREESYARADTLLEAVGLGRFGDHMPWQLSGGMQQRAQICRALIHDPSILLLDEPFGALDTFTREELWGVMQAVWLDKRCTVVLVTHELREAVYLSDTVHVMSARPGRVVASTTIELPRPRSLETTFEATFMQYVHDCRHHISHGNATS
jgi:NitT/TauT family transport system ATP-binding protein